MPIDAPSCPKLHVGNPTNMKAFVEKTFESIAHGVSAISSRVYSRRSSSLSPVTDQMGGGNRELDMVTNNIRATSMEAETSRNSSPSPPLSPVEKYITPEEDEVLYSKNNVLLKYPPRRIGGEQASSNGGTTDSGSEVLIPGFLFITTRGSNFGSTLLLNWAPNSSMRVPENDTTPSTAAAESDQSRFDLERPSCSSVSIDLSKMEIIRIFCHKDDDGFVTKGEMVISGKDRNFKVFHFRNGGLNELIQIFRSWQYFNHHVHKPTQQHTFTIFCPKLSLEELHPMEGKVKSVLTEEMWKDLLDPEGRITDVHYVRKVVFFKGVLSSFRKEVWPFLLGLYEFDSTRRQRIRIQQKRHEEYWAINSKRESEAAERESFRMVMVHQIDKDVVRTDRSHPYYQGDENTHVGTLKKILLNYLVFKPEVSYSQGMTDLLAPLLAALDDEAEAFWCFTKLVEGTAFFRPAKNHISVDRQLEPLRMLIKMLIPKFYSYLEQTEGGLSLMFCHRWLLVCLKREFSEEDALCLWEACWSNFETNSFHLFVCIAIMAIYGQKAVDNNMNINELMVFFNTLSHSMPREIVMAQARGYLYQFSRSSHVHCSLYSVMHKEFWDQPDSPKLMCNICKGFGGCTRTDFPSDREVMC